MERLAEQRRPPIVLTGGFERERQRSDAGGESGESPSLALYNALANRTRGGIDARIGVGSAFREN